MSNVPRSDTQPEFENYLPGTNPATAPGPVGRILTRLFRRRGRF